MNSLFPRGGTLLTGLLVSAFLFLCKQCVEHFTIFGIQVAVYASLGCFSLLLFCWVLWNTERDVWYELIDIRRDQGDDDKKSR